jgi:transcriptional regulator with PAS, ATPase and Fis domain
MGKRPTLDTLVEEDSRDESEPSARGWLVSIGSPEDNFASAGRIFEVTGGNTVKFGRDDGADSIRLIEEGTTLDIGIPFGWVSGSHAELEVFSEGGGLRFGLQDLGSRNGTLANGKRITGPVKVRSGDVFEVGRSFWTVREVRLRRPRPGKAGELDPTGTCNPHLHHIHRTLHRLAKSSIPILLRGETGTGKEYLARALHRVSGRDGPFVVANLAAMSEDRVETLLFGNAEVPGLFEQANGGTLMLDELAELSPPVQNKLRSALTEGRAARVGEETKRAFDVRLVASTLRDLSQMVESGAFRPDLYSRLAGFVAELPPLRGRREDLGLLCRACMEVLHREGRPTRLTTNAFRRILGRAWPFNVRQLEQSINTVSLLASGDGTITADALGEIIDQDEGLPQNPDEVRSLRADLVKNLAACHGDLDDVASAMNKDRLHVERWLERFALSADSYHR